MKMHYKINTSDTKGNMNTGSCSKLVNYLEKENQNNWFTQSDENITSDKVQSEIDQYGKGQLRKEEWKFVEIEVNPSHKEQQIIIERATGKKDISDWNNLNDEEKKKSIQEFKNYVRDFQDEQALNYDRDKIRKGEDLKYYAKIETERRVNGYDEDYKLNKAKQGEKKKGLNMHAHIVQSRKSKDKKTKLSPASKHRTSSTKSRIKQGFDRNKFAQRIESKFDNRYQYERPLKETFQWKKANKLNRLDKKIELNNNYKSNQKMKSITKVHQELSQNENIQNYQDYKSEMNKQGVEVEEMKNEKNETYDLKLKNDKEEKRFSQLQEETKFEKNEEIKSRWIKEQENRKEQIQQEKTRQHQKSSEISKKQEKNRDGLSI